ncbi:unnamed protein product [Mytilus coruscus]|uniref:OTU domain-containing protein n=1 Tax=Mytilus coruscus TaxID=42192 RepID=A0A6J8E0X2_MYTCO|nr:unnamed protein product [Mytilus coruscus]
MHYAIDNEYRTCIGVIWLYGYKNTQPRLNSFAKLDASKTAKEARTTTTGYKTKKRQKGKQYIALNNLCHLHLTSLQESVLAGITASATPRKRAALENDGIILTPSKRRRLDICSQSLAKITDEIQSKKYKRSKLALSGDAFSASSIVWSSNTHMRKNCELAAEIGPFSAHLHNAAWQYEQFSTLIKNVPEKWVVFCMDFAENYTCLYQDEAQSAHWNHVDKDIAIVTHNLAADRQAIDCMPRDGLALFGSMLPVCVVGDGNCLPRSASVACFGNETAHKEIRARIVVEMCLYKHQYVDNEYLNKGVDLPKKKLGIL